MKILFIGCVKSSFYFLKSIYENTSTQIIGVVTKVESKYNADHVSLHPFCEENNIDWIDYKDSNQLLNWIKIKKPDIIYCFGWSYLLPKEVYTFPKLGAVGYHPTLLPQNRGRHPIIWTIALGLKKSGSTFFYLSETPDSGPILSQKEVELDEFETANTLYNKLILLGSKQVVEMTKAIQNSSITPRIQDESKANYWRKRGKKDGMIDWRMNAKSIVNLVNALSKPYMGAHFTYEGNEIIVWKATIVKDVNIANIECGKIVRISEDTFTVKTGDFLIEITLFEGAFTPKVGMYL